MNEEEIRKIIRDEIGKIKFVLEWPAEMETWPTKTEAKPQPANNSIIKDFPVEVQQFLSAELKGGVWYVRSKFVSKPKWNLINKYAKSMGGKWISLGKESHWEIPKEDKE